MWAIDPWAEMFRFVCTRMAGANERRQKRQTPSTRRRCFHQPRGSDAIEALRNDIASEQKMGGAILSQDDPVTVEGS